MLVTYLLQVTLCLALFFIFYHFVLHKETMFLTNRIYLVSTLLASLILPLIRIYILDLQQETTLVTAPYIYVGSYLNAMGDAITVVPHDNGISWLKVFTGIYISGVLIMSFRLFKSIGTILKIRKYGERMWISNKECFMSEDVKSPFSFLATIYLPADHSFNEVELTEIISHEQAHITGKHSLDVLFMELTCIGIWPSPMVYLYRKMLREVHEFLADAAVIKDSPWENYAQFLVAQKANNLQNILSNQLIYSQLKNRLMMMTQRPSTFAARFKYLGIIPILLLSLVIFSFREKSILNSTFSNPTNEILQNNADGIKVNGLDANGPKTDTVLLEITKGLKYYVNHVLTPFSKLEQAILDASKNSVSPLVFLHFEKSLTVGDLSNVMSMGYKHNFRFVLQTPDAGTNRANNEVRENYFITDSMPATYITAYRFTESPSEVDGSKEYKPNLDIYEDMAIFPGCEDVPIRDRGICGQTNLVGYINSHLIYPESLKKSGIEGKVIVRFTVGIDGFLKNIAIEKSLNPVADEAALNVFTNMNEEAGRWLPARKEGKSVEAEMWLPISFSLSEPKKKEISPSGGNKLIENTESVFQLVEQMPRFPGCEQLQESRKTTKISNGSINIPSGSVSVKVSAMGQVMKENVDYSIDYNTGRITILNQTFLKPEIPINVVFEDRAKSDCANEAMFKYLYESVKYPQEDRQKGFEGMVIVKFTVGIDGSISNIKVVRGVSPGLNEEIIRIVKGMNELPQKWIPGKNNGIPVPVELTLPFKFVLQDKDKNESKPALNQNIQQVENQVSVSISPNPANTFLQIEVPINVTAVSIFDSSGKLILNKQLSGDQINKIQDVDVSKWTSGTYVAQLKAGSQTYSSSFVVQH